MSPMLLIASYRINLKFRFDSQSFVSWQDFSCRLAYFQIISTVMKRVKRQYLKTQASVDENKQQKKVAKDWVLCSSQRQKNVPCTPLRFAEIKSRKDASSKQQLSTNDREQSNLKLPSKFQLIKYEVADAIKLLRNVGNKENIRPQQSPKQVSPFVLNPNNNFEEQISFKGVSNKLSLLQQAERIERQAMQLLSQISGLKLSLTTPLSIKQHLNHQKSEQIIQPRFSQLLGLSETIEREFDDFLVQLNRCRGIMVITTGITDKSLYFYKSRFQSLIEGFSSKISCIRKYIDLVLLQRQKGKERKLKIKIS